MERRNPSLGEPPMRCGGPRAWLLPSPGRCITTMMWVAVEELKLSYDNGYI